MLDRGVSRRLLACAAATLFALGSAGCNSSRLTDSGPVYAPANVRGFDRWPADVLRVAVLPAHDVGGDLTPEFVAPYDLAWTRALDRVQRAELVRVTRPGLSRWAGRESFGSTDALPAGFLERMARETGAQAVLLLDLTHVKAYPPLALGFRAKLVRFSDGAIIWAADELFDAADAGVARAARHQARAGSGSYGPGDPTHGVAQSPAVFADYAFGAVAPLLPPRLAPEVEPAAKPEATAKTSAAR